MKGRGQGRAVSQEVDPQWALSPCLILSREPPIFALHSTCLGVTMVKLTPFYYACHSAVMNLSAFCMIITYIMHSIVISS